MVFTISALGSNFKWGILDNYKKTYRKSRAYKAFIKSHPDHLYDLDVLINRIIATDFYKNSDTV